MYIYILRQYVTWLIVCFNIRINQQNMLEKKRNKGIVKLGNNSSTMVVTHKQGRPVWSVVLTMHFTSFLLLQLCLLLFAWIN